MDHELRCVEVQLPGFWPDSGVAAMSHAFAPPVVSGARCQCGQAQLTLAGTVEELSHELRAALPSFPEALAEPPHGRVGANAAVEEAVARIYNPPGEELCDCGHVRDAHEPACTGLDGYGVRCVCPAFTDWTDQDED